MEGGSHTHTHTKCGVAHMTAGCGRQQAFGVPLEEVGNSQLLYCMSVQGNREGEREKEKGREG